MGHAETHKEWNDRESSRCIKLNYEDIKKLRRDFLKMIDEMDNHNNKMEEIEERLYSGNETMVKYLPRITVCLEEIAKNEGGDMFDIKGDSLKLIDEMDIRKQENINLSHRIKKLETMLTDYQPKYNK